MEKLVEVWIEQFPVLAVMALGLREMRSLLKETMRLLGECIEHQSDR